LTPATVDTGPGSIDTGSASIDMSIYIWDFNTGHGKSFKVEVCGDLTR
jgi:hypothetical protein